jgi:hypothetical protein
MPREVSLIVRQWADKLSQKLGRPAEAIRERGLGASDFRGNSELEIRFPDASTATFRHAFFVHDAGRGLVAVFTEHCGYYEFPAHGLVISTVTRETRYFDAKE